MDAANENDREYIGTKEVARQLGVGVTTVQRWIDSGALGCRRTLGGHRRVRLDDVRTLAKEMGIDLPSTWIEETRPLVLIVDDDPDVVMFLEAIFARHYPNVRVQSAIHGFEAGVTLARMTTGPDLIMLDIRMDDINGIEVCRIIRQDLEFKSHIIGVTVSREPEEIMGLLAAGAEEIIYKPLTTDVVLETLKSILPYPGDQRSEI